MESIRAKTRNLFGWIGTVCLLLILPIKLLRFLFATETSLLIGIAPSILGPPGFLFLLLSSTGRLSRLTILQATLITGAVAMGLELLQLLPRPGILARVHYTFDYLDLAASLLSLLAAYVVAGMLTNSRGS